MTANKFGKWYVSGFFLIQRANVYVCVTVCVCVRLKNYVFSLSLLSPLNQGNTLSLTNDFTYPHCFLTEYKSLWRVCILARIFKPFPHWVTSFMNHSALLWLTTTFVALSCSKYIFLALRQHPHRHLHFFSIVFTFLILRFCYFLLMDYFTITCVCL